jgi:hypothetical protein
LTRKATGRGNDERGPRALGVWCCLPVEKTPLSAIVLYAIIALRHRKALADLSSVEYDAVLAKCLYPAVAVVPYLFTSRWRGSLRGHTCCEPPYLRKRKPVGFCVAPMLHVSKLGRGVRQSYIDAPQRAVSFPHDSRNLLSLNPACLLHSRPLKGCRSGQVIIANFPPA